MYIYVYIYMRSQRLASKSHIQNPRYPITDLKFQIPNPKSQILDPKSQNLGTSLGKMSKSEHG